MKTKWLHNPVEGDTTQYYRKKQGITVEHMVRSSRYNMHYNHFHQEYEIYLLLKGSRQFFFDNRAYHAEEGSLILVDSSQIHMSHSVSNDINSNYERIILYIDSSKVAQYDSIFKDLKMGDYIRKHYGIYQLSKDQQKQMYGMYQKVMREMDEGLPHSQTAVDLEIINWFISFCREHKPVSFLKDPNEGNNKGKYSTVYAVSDYISVHFCEKITLDSLSARFFISKYYLSRFFREVTGVGINEYINILRVQKAQYMLIETNMSISDIATELGFDSISYFERIFKRHLAISPKQFRKYAKSNREELSGE